MKTQKKNIYIYIHIYISEEDINWMKCFNKKSYENTEGEPNQNNINRTLFLFAF